MDGDAVSDALTPSNSPTTKADGSRELYQASLKQQAFYRVEKFLSHLGKNQDLKFCQTHPAEWKLQLSSSCADVESIAPTHSSIHKGTTGFSSF